MSTTRKPPPKVAAVAHKIGQRTLPEYVNPFSRKHFTLPQLFACLVLRKFYQTDYRGITAILTDNPTLFKDIALQKTPHFTTLQKAERKLLDDRSHRNMLDQTLAMCFELNDKTGDDSALREAQSIEQAAADSTGFDLDYAWQYFTRRKRKPRKNKGETKNQPVIYRRFTKLDIVVCCATHLILSTHCGVGPRPDVDELRPLYGTDGDEHRARTNARRCRLRQ